MPVIVGKTIDQLNQVNAITASDELVVYDAESGTGVEPTKKITGSNLASSVKTLGSLLGTSDVVNDLTSTATDKPLAAAQGKALSEAIAQSTAKTYYESTSFSQAIADAGLTAPYLTEALNTINTGIGSITTNAVQNQTVNTSGPVCFAVYAKVNDTYYVGIIFTYYYNPAVYGFYRKQSTYGVKAL